MSEFTPLNLPQNAPQIQKESLKSEPSKNAPLKPPLQPLNIKTGYPPFVLIVLIAFGFAASAALFAFLSKGIMSPKTKPSNIPKVQKPQVQTEVEVVEPKAVEIAPAAVVEKPLPTLVLSGILFGEKGSFALINGRVIHEGSTIEGAKLEKVLADRVELSFEGKTIILRSR